MRLRVPCEQNVSKDRKVTRKMGNRNWMPARPIRHFILSLCEISGFWYLPNESRPMAEASRLRSR